MKNKSNLMKEKQIDKKKLIEHFNNQRKTQNYNIKKKWER